MRALTVVHRPGDGPDEQALAGLAERFFGAEILTQESEWPPPGVWYLINEDSFIFHAEMDDKPFTVDDLNRLLREQW